MHYRGSLQDLIYVLGEPNYYIHAEIPSGTARYMKHKQIHALGTNRAKYLARAKESESRGLFVTDGRKYKRSVRLYASRESVSEEGRG